MKLADQSHASDVRCPLIRPGSVLLSRVYGSCLTVSCWTHVSLARSCWIRVLQAAITIRLFLKRRTFVFFCFRCLKKLCADHFILAKKKSPVALRGPYLYFAATTQGATGMVHRGIPWHTGFVCFHHRMGNYEAAGRLRSALRGFVGRAR